MSKRPGAIQWLARRLDPQALHAYLTFNYIPVPMTIFQGIHKLPPGHLLRCGGGEVRLRQYWDLEWPEPAAPSPQPRDQGNPESCARRLREILEQAVRAHLLSDVPVGVLLSGGIDSSAITALAARSGARVKTFSVGFEEKSFNGLEAARLVAHAYATDHHEALIRPNGGPAGAPAALIERIVDHFDEPFADSSALPTFLVSQMAAREVKVVLSGDGGDETFAGYLTYSADELAEIYRRLPRALRHSLIEPLIRRLPVSEANNSLDYLAKRFVAAAHLPPLERNHAWRVIFTEADKRHLYSPDWQAHALQDPLAVLEAHYRRLDGLHFISKLQHVDTKTYLPDDILTKVDRMSMAHSLETRPPLLDHHVVEYAASLPAQMKVRGLKRKLVLKQAVADLLPAPLLRRRKHGFSIPVAAWLCRDLRSLLLDALSPPALRRCGIFNCREIARLIEDHLEARRDLGRNLWGLLVFMIWHERFLTRQPPRTRPEVAHDFAPSATIGANP